MDMQRFERNHALEAGAQRAAEQYDALLEEAKRLRAVNAELLAALEQCAEELNQSYDSLRTIAADHPAVIAYERARAVIAKAKR